LEVGEDCDDGNAFNNDGCSTTCQLEDSSGSREGSQWVCSAEVNKKTVCCRSLINPVTGQFVCDCATQTSTYEGYYVTPQCVKKDVDECANNNGGCMPEATCENLNGVFELGTRNCRCPTGMNGDGVSRCDLLIYTTRLTLSIENVSPQAMTIQQITAALYASSVVPLSVDSAHLTVELADYDISGVASTLLTVVMISESQADMQTLTTNEVSLLNISYVYTGKTVSVIQPPISIIDTVDSAYGALKTTLSGKANVYALLFYVLCFFHRINPNVYVFCFSFHTSNI
jgi:cysteine-rich repeat protein